MSIDYYHTRVRQAISDEYVKCSKKRQEYLKRHAELTCRLALEKKTLPYDEYEELYEENQLLVMMIGEEEVKLDVWDQAREICLNIADEMEETK